MRFIFNLLNILWLDSAIDVKFSEIGGTGAIIYSSSFAGSLTKNMCLELDLSLFQLGSIVSGANIVDDVLPCCTKCECNQVAINFPTPTKI